MNDKGTPKNKKRRNKVFISLTIIAINLMAFISVAFIYAAYTKSYGKKLYNENINNIANLNVAASNAVETYIESMSVKLDDVVNYIEAKNFNYEEVIRYLGESNTNKNRQMQLVCCGYYENGTLRYGDYQGVGVRKEEVDGSLSTMESEISYKVGYSELAASFKDIEDENYEGICFTPEFTNADTKLKTFAIYRHVIIEDRNGEEAIYIILLAINSEKAQSMYNTQIEYDGQSTVLMDADGEYIIRSNYFKNTNFYDYLRNYNEMSLEEKMKIKEAVETTIGNENGQKSMTLVCKNHQEQECIFAITAMSNHWYSVTCVPQSSFSMIDEETNYSLSILTVFVLLFVIDGSAVCLVNKVMKANVLLAKKATEEANNANQAKSRFLSTMSHELRTPLNAIIGMAALSMKNIRHPEILEDYLAKIEISSKLLLQLISDILDISVIESNKMKINKNEFDLTNLISTISAIYYEQCNEKKIEFKVVLVNMHSDTAEHLIGDAMRVSQILLNFLSNAVKFTPSGGTVTLTVEKIKEDENAVIRFSVMDTGCGISDELKTRLFRPFEQERDSKARQYGGTGLGLSIAKNLTELMGGTIEMESEEGVGTQFSAEIPFEIAQQQEYKEYDKIENIHMIVVISEKYNREYIGKIMELFGVEYTLVDNAVSAFSLLRQEKKENHSFTVCILDWNLSDFDVITATKKIRSEFKSEKLRIMVMAYDLVLARVACMEAGANMVIAKPVFASNLYHALQEVTTGNVTITTKAEEEYDFTGHRILLVEDNKFNQMVASLLLEGVGVNVENAENGQIAYERFLASEPGYFSAILMDIQMPVMNGYEATKAIRSSEHSQAATIPILAMTADAFSEDVERAAEAGMNEHLAKPIDPDTLYKNLKKYIF